MFRVWSCDRSFACAFFFSSVFAFCFCFCCFKGLVVVRQAEVGDAGGAARSELETAHEGEWDRERNERTEGGI